MRISKAPEERRQEILDTAMQLFSIKGYEATSMADIANAMHVARGLCYRYFDSKQKLFEEAMDQYVTLCCSEFIPIIHDRSKSYQVRLKQIAIQMTQLEKTAKYHAFFHQEVNRNLHEQLSLQMCHYLYLHIMEEVHYLEEQGMLHIENADILVRFILYGQIGLIADHSIEMEDTISILLRYIKTLLHT